MSHNTTTAEASRAGRAFNLRRILHSPLALPLIGLIVVSILMGFASENFFSVSNIMNVLRQVSIVGILAVAAFATPPDFISQIMLTVPVYGLYEISIWIVSVMERKAAEEEAELNKA